MSRFRRLAFVAVVIAGCSSSSAFVPEQVHCPANYEEVGCVIPQSTEPCSTGPAHTVADFPQSTNIDGQYARCTPRCGTEALPMGDDLAQVPSGACSTEGDICDMSLGLACHFEGGITEPGPVSGLRCTCEKGTWACAITEQGAGICARALGEGGT